MALVNIGNENAADSFHRYKMPKLIAKVEGRGNGIKTNVVNNQGIAQALSRPPEYILKFFGCQLGAQTKYDKATGTSIVNGSFDAKQLSDLLEDFIKRYVQCYSCGNPETDITVKREAIHLECKACGAISDVDMRHKVNGYILKNAPTTKVCKEVKRLKKAEDQRMQDAMDLERQEHKDKSKKSKEKKDKDKKDKKKKKKGSGDEANGEDEGDAGGEEDEAGEVWATDTSAEAVARRAAEQLTQATSALVVQGNIEAEEAEKKAAEKKAAERAARKEAVRLEAEKAAEAARAPEKLDAAAAAEKLRALLDADPETGLPRAAPAAVAEAVRALSVEGNQAGRMRALNEALFVGISEKLGPALLARKAYLAPHVQDMQSQLAQLVALEHLCAVTLPADRLKEIAPALKALFDANLAEDDIILAWAERLDAARVLGVPPQGAADVRRAAAPLVEWLADEAEDDSEEDDEGSVEEDDDDA